MASIPRRLAVAFLAIALATLSLPPLFSASFAGAAAPASEVRATISGSGLDTIHTYRLTAPEDGRVDYELWVQYEARGGRPDQAFAILFPVSAISGYVDLWTPPDDPDRWIYLYAAGNAPHTKVGVSAAGETVYYSPEEGRLHPLFFPSWPRSDFHVSEGEYLLVIASSNLLEYTGTFTNLTLRDGPTTVERALQRYTLQEGHFSGASAQADVRGVPLGSVTTGASLTIETDVPGFFFIEVVQGSAAPGNVTLTGPTGADIELTRKWNYAAGVMIGGGTLIGPQGGIWQADLLTGHHGIWRVDVDPAAGAFFDVIVAWVPFA